MCRKYFLLIMIIICTFLLTFMPLFAQEEVGEIIIISERVGKEIDRKERDKFELFKETKGFQLAPEPSKGFQSTSYLKLPDKTSQLFPDINGFQSAVFIKLPDNTYLLKIRYLVEKTGELKVKQIKLSEESINKYRYHINHFGNQRNIYSPKYSKADTSLYRSIRINYSGNMRSFKEYPASRYIGINFEQYRNTTKRYISAAIHNSKNEDALLIYLVSGLGYEYKYWGWQLGLLFAGWEDDMTSGMILLPVGGLKFGLMDKIYVSGSIFDETLNSFIDINLSYIFGYPNGSVSVGISQFLDSFYHIKLKFSALNRILFYFKGRYNKVQNYGEIIGGIGIYT